MDRPDQTTHFGFRDVPLGEKQTLVNDVFHSVASRYDLMNDLMSVGLHRVWKDIMINALNPPRGDTPFALLDVAGGTGDIAFRAAKAAGPGFRATVCDINSDMLKVGRERAAARHLDDRVSFVEGNAETLAFPDRHFDGYTIAFGIRNVPRIDLALARGLPGAQARRPILVPGILHRRRARAGPDLRSVFVQGDPAARPRRDRRRRILPIPRRIHSQISQAERVCRDDPWRRLFPRHLAEPLGRHRGLAFGLAFVISALTHIARLARAGFVFAREGVFGVVDPSLVPPPGQLALRLARIVERPGAKSGPRLSRALTRLGPAYLKLGQFLATRPDVVGVVMARDLEALQDRLPPFSQSEAEAVIAQSLERPVAQAFVSLGPPVAAASIAQVHRGETEQNGVRKSVAVKVLRPDVAARFRRDLGDFFFVAHSAETYSAEARRLRLVEVINTMSRSVAMEMDLRLEAAALSEMAENTRDDPDFRVPTVDWDRTAHNVLTMEWIDGIALSDHARLEEAQVDLPDLGRKVIQSFLRHALRDGFFHADMHPGNLFLDDAGRLVAVDFGIMGRLGLKERRFLAEILLGFITRDYRRVAEVHFEAGYVPPHHSVENFAQAIRAIGEPIHNRTAEEISMAKLLTLLLEVTGLFDMRTRPELILLQKTMVVVEGVARSFDPKLDIWKIADPVVREWIERNLGPIGRIQGAMSGAGDLGRVLAGLPTIAARSVAVLEQLETMTREGLTLSPETIAAMGRTEGRKSRWRTLALWIIAATFIAILFAVRNL